MIMYEMANIHPAALRQMNIYTVHTVAYMYSYYYGFFNQIKECNQE